MGVLTERIKKKKEEAPLVYGGDCTLLMLMQVIVISRGTGLKLTGEGSCILFAFPLSMDT